MTKDHYRVRVLPELACVSVRMIAAAMDVSLGYAARVRKGETVPHPHHWDSLARLGTRGSEVRLNSI